MELVKDGSDQFSKFTDILKNKLQHTTLELLAFSECKHHAENTLEISDSLKDIISNSENIYVLTNQKEYNCYYIFSIILDSKKIKDEGLYNRSTIQFEIFDNQKDKELIKLLTESDDYIFIFRY